MWKMKRIRCLVTIVCIRIVCPRVRSRPPPLGLHFLFDLTSRSSLLSARPNLQIINLVRAKQARATNRNKVVWKKKKKKKTWAWEVFDRCNKSRRYRWIRETSSFFHIRFGLVIEFSPSFLHTWTKIGSYVRSWKISRSFFGRPR